MTTSQIASCAFTVGTVAVLPFYTLMVVAPNADIVSHLPPSHSLQHKPYMALALHARSSVVSPLMSSSPCSCAQTKRTVESSAPYVALGLLYAYLLYLSWTPDTLRAMFASKYWLPEVLTAGAPSLLKQLRAV